MLRGLPRRLWQRVRGPLARARGWAAFALSHLETGSTVLFDEPGLAGPPGPHVAVFCHFDGAGRIREHTRAYVEALRAERLGVVFVTNAGHLEPEDLEWVRARASRVVIRRNLGYDFAAWRDAIAAAALPAPDTRMLLIANDSVYGPLRPIRPALERMDFAAADVWSVTDSWQHRFHLQSFFVAFGPRALAHPAFPRFWSSVGNVRSKWWVVTRFEIGLTRAMLGAGLRCRALWPYTTLIERLREETSREERWEVEDGTAVRAVRREAGCDAAPRDPFAEIRRHAAGRVLGLALGRVPMNPTADLWQVLLEQGCPFLKRELLRDNPGLVPGVAAWSATVGAIDARGRDVILRDLERCLKDRSP
ncbi:rhamnan synthesis F family protein [Muricoccus vinaceus]|uniref:Rhamnan synthesis F family protein n=1 Tax=Muricoccus vinaceus TaxID=424704 RepID=A0ABV6IUU6_9PROT